MPIEIKPLFRPDAVRPKLKGFEPPPPSPSLLQKLANWSNLLGSKQAGTMKETELLADFIRDVFVDLLGYVPPPAMPYTLKREALVEVDGKFADAGFGRFDGERNAFAAVLEGKGPRDPLDRPFAGRKRSAVEQALQYAVQLRIDWYLVANLKEIRLYHKGHDTFTYERFDTAQLADNDDERIRPRRDAGTPRRARRHGQAEGAEEKQPQGVRRVLHACVHHALHRRPNARPPCRRTLREAACYSPNRRGEDCHEGSRRSRLFRSANAQKAADRRPGELLERLD